MKVTFQIENAAAVTVDCNPGDNLLELARRANVAIDAPCSGNGSCGKCRVKLLSGELETIPSRHISEEEFSQGWRLSCNCKVVSDATVLVPDIASAYQSRMKTADLSSPQELRIFEECQDCLKASGISFENDFRAVTVSMDAPTLDDTMPDNERLTWALQSELGVENIEIPYPVMVKMANVLRRNGFTVCVKGLLKENTSNNLWGNYNTNPSNDPFQIESNFGYTAGVAEMLVQSHAGYIEFLPCLPDAWQTGSFTGLTTRGNFAVDAVWQNGQAVSFTIHSRSGEPCGVRYPGIEKATVVDSAGDEVVFEVEETGLIRFDTAEGESYTIKNIPANTRLPAPESVSLSVEGATGTVRWRETGKASAYNVYEAVGDEPEYTLLEAGVTGGEYSFAKASYAGKRVTFRFTAVAADGTESAGTTVVLVPEV